jgi:hypothetical protein
MCIVLYSRDKDDPTKFITDILVDSLVTLRMVWVQGPRRILLVKEAAARFNIDGRFYTVQYDHIDVCKPLNTEDIRFKMLTDIIDGKVSSTSAYAPSLEQNTEVV